MSYVIQGEMGQTLLNNYNNITQISCQTDYFHVHRRLDWTLHWIVNYYTDVNLSRTMQRETTHVLVRKAYVKTKYVLYEIAT